VESVARTFGDLVDLKTPRLLGHSSAVAALASDAAQSLGIGDQQDLRVAGHLHDVGRVGVSSRIWAKPGPLSASERDQARLHPYYTERILSRVPALAGIAVLAGQHHERLDGSGYHRGVNSSQLTLPSRVLAASDCYRSQLEERPHRPAASAGEAARRLQAEVMAGRLDEDAVAGVLDAAGLSNPSIPLIAYGIVVVICRVVFAKVPDRVPTLPLGASALGIIGAGLIMTAVWATPVGIVTAALILGVGVAFSTPAYFTAIFTTTKPSERGAASGTASAFLDLGIGGGPIMLGFVAQSAGIPWAFGVGAAVAVIGAIWTLTLTRTHREMA